MKRTTAPFFGSDVGDRFGEIPTVPIEVLSIVLAFAIGLVCWLGQDHRSILPRVFAVRIGIFDADLDHLRLVRRHLAFGDGEAAITRFHLDAVICDPKTDGKAKGL